MCKATIKQVQNNSFKAIFVLCANLMTHNSDLSMCLLSTCRNVNTYFISNIGLQI